MRTVTLEELLEAGCHFGHQVTRQNPKAREFIFEARDNIHIIDLAKTKEGLEAAAAFVKALAQRGGSLLIVGTKRQAKPIVEEEVKRAQDKDSGEMQKDEQVPTARLFTITDRWVGGVFTNFTEVAKNVKKLKDFTSRLQNEEEKAKYTKKEVGQWEKERQKLEALYGGILEMKKIPDAVFVIDTHIESLAVKEARRMNVTTLGVVDTNADPYLIDYPIPANDDAVGSIKLITSYIIDAWVEGMQSLLKKGESHEKREKVAKNTKTSTRKVKTANG